MNQFIKRTAVFFSLFYFAANLAGKAQDTTFTPARIKAAQDLLILMKEPERYVITTNNMIVTQSKALPADKQQPFADVMRAFIDKYVSWDKIKDREAQIYAGAFSEAELNELLAFYKTPIGQKVITTLPNLQLKGINLGESLVMAHRDELQEMIKTAFADH